MNENGSDRFRLQVHRAAIAQAKRDHTSLVDRLDQLVAALPEHATITFTRGDLEDLLETERRRIGLSGEG